MQERRSSIRHKTLLAGKVVYGVNRFVMDCAIRDLSAEGARLTFANPLGVPDEFELEIPQRAQHCRCETRWRRGNQIGVLFLAVSVRSLPAGYAEAG